MLNQINFNTLRMHYIFLLLLNVHICGYQYIRKQTTHFLMQKPEH